MTTPRDGAYVWAAWLSRLLVGDNSCEWAAWFRAHNQYQKVPSTRDWTDLKMRHTKLLQNQREELESAGYIVHTEGQAEFRLHGSTATLHGRPDLLAVSPERALICEAKAGKPYPSHHAQLMVYMYALPEALRRGSAGGAQVRQAARELPFDGVLVYEDGSRVEVRAAEIDAAFKGRLGALIRRISDPAPARKVPSRHECAFCDIPASECPEREAQEVIEGETEDF